MPKFSFLTPHIDIFVSVARIVRASFIHVHNPFMKIAISGLGIVFVFIPTLTTFQSTRKTNDFTLPFKW